MSHMPTCSLILKLIFLFLQGIRDSKFVHAFRDFVGDKETRESHFSVKILQWILEHICLYQH
jgi:hypothetical protein